VKRIETEKNLDESRRARSRRKYYLVEAAASEKIPFFLSRTGSHGRISSDIKK